MHLLAGKVRGGGQLSGRAFLEAAEVSAPSFTRVYKSQTTSHTFSSLSIGAAHPARQIVVGVTLSDAAVDGVVGVFSSVTCNGVSMTEVIKSDAQNRSHCGIFRVPQGSLPDSTVTTADFVLTSTSSVPHWTICVHRVLSYDASPVTQTARETPTIIGSNTMDQSPAISQDAGSVVVGVFVWGGNTSDGMTDGEHAWSQLLVEGDQHYFPVQGGTGDSAAHASAAFASAISSKQQRHVYTAAPNTGAMTVAACAAAWKKF